MDLSFSEKHEAFRQEVREWIQAALPPNLAERAAVFATFDYADAIQWQKILHEKGWAAPGWPAEVGGTGWDVAQRSIFDEELEAAGAPQLIPFGLSMVGPLLIQFGTPAQKARYLPKILSAEEQWCQGYSEPNAGSDLASLATEAALEGDHFLVTGQKTWTTYAQYADWVFCLVRTDPSARKQAGISFLLIDMKSEGVTVKPMLTSGGTPAFCDVYFDKVRVPKQNLVGQMNEGWTMAKALLGHERTYIAAVGQCLRAIQRTKHIAANTVKNGRPLLEDPVFRSKLASLEIQLEAHRMTNYRAVAAAQLDHAPGPEASILKIVGSTILQRATELAMEAAGPNALDWFNDVDFVTPVERGVPSWFNYSRATTIYGGANEIQKNIIAKAILRLPQLGEKP